VTEPLTFLHPEPRVYGKTQPDGVSWVCPDCGALVEFLTGRSIHNRWHARIDGAELIECEHRIRGLYRGQWLRCTRHQGHGGPHGLRRDSR
jgi:hypothetical protein